MQFYDLFNLVTKETSPGLRERTKTSVWPDEWKTTYIKEYERFPSFPLPKAFLPESSFPDLIHLRKSERKFEGKLSKDQLSALLYYGLGEIDKSANDGRGRRSYASGGARFPLEGYVLLFKEVGDLPQGVYHYNVEDHALELIYNEPLSSEIKEKLVVYDFLQNAAAAILITGVLSRAFSKYREHSYRFALLEAGEVSQNLCLAATSLRVPSLNVGIVATDVVESLLDIDGIDEVHLHSLFFG